MAVMAESEISASGRVRASTEEMTARAEALSGRFPRIDQLFQPPSRLASRQQLVHAGRPLP